MKPYTTNPEHFEWFSHRDSILPFTFSTFVKAFIVIVIVIVATLVCCSCGSTKVATQIVRDVRTDTVYLNSRQYDSIYVYQERIQDHSRDTIYLKDVSVEYRYKMLRDTIYKTRVDSIPYQVTITEVKEITRPLTWFDKTCRACFFFLFGFLILWFLKKVGIIKPLYF